MSKTSLLRSAKRKLRWLPNTLTLCNSWCGFAAILVTLTMYERSSNVYDVLACSALIILGAMIFDVLDGYAARMLDATSECGVEMDSLSDMVTFGVAPAVLIAMLTHRLQGVQTTWQTLVTFFLCALYVGGAALRLATYNVHAMQDNGSSKVFHGLPSPGAAAAIASLVLAMRIYNGSLVHLAMILPFYAAILGGLMVSPLPYLHIGKWLLARGEWQSLKILLLTVLLFAVVVFRENAVFIVVTLYVLSGPAVALRNWMTYGNLRGKQN